MNTSTLIFFAVSVVLSLVLFSSCANSPKKLTSTDTPTLTAEKEGIYQGQKTVFNSANQIDKQVEEIDSKTTAIPELNKEISANTSAIRSETKTLRDVANSLVGTFNSLSAKDEQIKKLSKNRDEALKVNEKLTNQVKELKDQNSKLFYKMLSWLSIACVAGLGISVVIAIWFKNPLGIFAAVGFAAVLGVSVFVSLYASYIAWITAGIVVLFVLFMVWRAYTERKALVEVVHTTEATKNYINSACKMDMFTGPNNLADRIQSPETRDIVKKIRKTT